MDIVARENEISADERAQIKQQVKAELIEHLYQGCLPGTISGIPVGIAIFIDFYQNTPTWALISWFIFYNIALFALTALFFFYQRYKNERSLDYWLRIYTILMSICALTWAVCVFLIPDNLTRQYFAFMALFLIATGYAMGSIGVFELCMVTLTIIVVPLIVWCFMKGSLFYHLIGFFAVIYIGFMSWINRRSTEWFKDSLKLKLENTLVSYQANHDLLTNLPNQRLIPQYINSAMAFVKDKSSTFAVVSFSLNRMEMVTDSLGQQAGNTIIQSVSARLTILSSQAAKTPGDTQYIVTISRKDTFNIIVVPLAVDEVEDKVRKLFSVLDDTIYLESRGVKLTASMGVSLYPNDGENAESLLANADAAMLQAKQIGGNRLEFYRTEINAQIPKQLALEIDLHAALKNQQLLVYYQPLVDIRQNKIIGMEALLRWPHPIHGFISPAQFIPIAEDTGLIIPIGEWILQEACKQTFLWHQMGFTDLKVSVNLSEKQLRDKSIVDTVKHALLISHLDAKNLELELTETSILDETVIPIIQTFKNLGLSLAVDDFGTGYSGLSYLKRFAIDKLKIDQSFIRDIPANHDSMTIVSAIIAMGRELAVSTLAEGVETEAQLQFLMDKGCDYVQGYYYSKPVESSFFTQLLLKSRGKVAHED